MIAMHLIDLGKPADAEQDHAYSCISFNKAVQVFKETILVPESGQRVDMSLYAVISYGAGKVVQFSVLIPYHDSAAGAHIIFSRDASCPVLHVMSCGISRKEFIDPFMIFLPVLRVDLVLPDITCSVHIL